MGKLKRLLMVLGLISMTMGSAFALEEAGKAPQPDGQNRQEGRVPAKFTEDDADGDGVVSRTEFSGPADHFDRLDRNGDGVIQESEARQGPSDRIRPEQSNR